MHWVQHFKPQSTWEQAEISSEWHRLSDTSEKHRTATAECQNTHPAFRLKGGWHSSQPGQLWASCDHTNIAHEIWLLSGPLTVQLYERILAKPFKRKQTSRSIQMFPPAESSGLTRTPRQFCVWIRIKWDVTRLINELLCVTRGCQIPNQGSNSAKPIRAVSSGVCSLQVKGRWRKFFTTSAKRQDAEHPSQLATCTGV